MSYPEGAEPICQDLNYSLLNKWLNIFLHGIFFLKLSGTSSEGKPSAPPQADASAEMAAIRDE